MASSFSFNQNGACCAERLAMTIDFNNVHIIEDYSATGPGNTASRGMTTDAGPVVFERNRPAWMPGLPIVAANHGRRAAAVGFDNVPRGTFISTGQGTNYKNYTSKDIAAMSFTRGLLMGTIIIAFAVALGLLVSALLGR